MSELTRREFEIIEAISWGLNNDEISKRLFISVHTVKSHRKNVLQKARVRNSAHLIRKSFENGWLRK